MSYKAISIFKIVNEIDSSKYYLPAIQRKFIWKKSQIEKYFDSIMRDYPIGSFLFWKLQSDKAVNYTFYEFLKHYTEKNPLNQIKTGGFNGPEINGILDGQQRLSSIYLGLKGTYTERVRYGRKSNNDSYETSILHLNILNLPFKFNESEEEIIALEEKNFEFKFLTNEEISKDKNSFWLSMHDALIWPKDPEFDFEIQKLLKKCNFEEQKNKILTNQRFIKKALEILHKRLREQELINYFEIEKNDLEDILNIFVRVNSGGTVLDKTDLLFSMIVANWPEGRAEIEKLLTNINSGDDAFAFTNEYLMRCCLVLTDAPVLYKIDSFKQKNVDEIKNNWKNIYSAIMETKNLLQEFGFNQKTLTSNNSTIIIAYYIYNNGDLSADSKKNIKKYLINSLLNGIYGGSQEGVISSLREYFKGPVVDPSEKRKRIKIFSFDNLIEAVKLQNKSFKITTEDIEDFLTYTKGNKSFLILSLLYPNLRFNLVAFHQDHIHPSARFSEKYFKEIDLSKEKWNEWIKLRDCIPNLQLMEGKENSAKNDSSLIEYYEKKVPTHEKDNFRKSNYFPENIDLNFGEFIDFYENRKEILRSELTRILNPTNEVLPNSRIRVDEDDEQIDNDENQ